MTRIEKLREKLGAGFSAALVEDEYNRAYLAEFRSSAGTLIVTEDDALFIIDFRYIEVAGKTVKGATVVLQENNLNRQIAEYLASKGIKKILVEDEMSVGRYGRLKSAMPEIGFVADGRLSAAVKKLRAVKEPKEIDAIKAAQAITDSAFEYICTFIKPGVTEREIAAELEYFMRKNGADGLAFDTIAVSGKNTSMPHGVPGDKKVEAGDFVTMDYGAKKDGYCSDMTRTVAVGHATDEMKKVYETVLKAHLSAREQARAGMTGQALDAIARDIIYGAGYEGKFGHGLGHSLGLEVHEDPRASALYTGMLESGVIMTIEPGIYLPGDFGVRIENMIVLGNDGSENLTGSPTDLIIL